ncbi:MAG: SH3 domain-containing protein [Firmicutes bacterium]|nr:SH3 domain-containing protein [Bacillota bacterium]
MDPKVAAAAITILLYLFAAGEPGQEPGQGPQGAPANPPVSESTKLEPPQSTIHPMPGTEPAQQPTHQAPGSVVTVKDPRVRVRGGPGTNYRVVTTIKRGTPLRVLTSHNSWYQVRLPDGRAGWIASFLVEGGKQQVGGEARRAGNFEIIGYYAEDYPGERASYASLSLSKDMLSGVALFSFKLDASGGVTGEHLSAPFDLVRSNGITPLALVHNYSHSAGGFDAGIISSMLRSQARRERAINEIYAILKRYGYRGVNIDFENIPPGDREFLTKFMQELAARLKPGGYLVTMSVPAKWGDSPASEWIGAFDYYALGRICDKIMIMTYDEHGPFSGPGPVASASWVEKVIKYAITQIPRPKIMMGVPAYGYDWPIGWGGQARAVSHQQALRIAQSHGIRPLWHDEAKAPYFRYSSGNSRREVWFENESSIAAKIAIAKKYDLRGIAIWRLGYEDASYWRALRKSLGLG